MSILSIGFEWLMLAVISPQSENPVQSRHSVAENDRKCQGVNLGLSDEYHKSFPRGAVHIEIDTSALVPRNQLLCKRIKSVRNWLWHCDEHANGEVAESVNGRHCLMN